MARLSRKFRQCKDSRSLLLLWQVLHCPYTFAVSAAQNPDAITFRLKAWRKTVIDYAEPALPLSILFSERYVATEYYLEKKQQYIREDAFELIFQLGICVMQINS